jgi:sirohydrochlorin cobaltochelatase
MRAQASARTSANPRPFRVVLFAHGSRSQEWSSPFEDLLVRVGKTLGEDRVRLAFLGFTEPSLIECAREAADDGVQLLYVVPLFFGDGQHVRVDLPGLVKAARRYNPGLEVRVAGCLAEDQGFRDALLDRVLRLSGEIDD